MDRERIYKPIIANNIPSLIKWTGSKRSQASKIAQLIPQYKRYIEPFLGGGSLLFLTATPNSIASDIYRPLIQLWKLIQVSPEVVVNDYEEKWIELNKELDSINFKKTGKEKQLPELFYKVRTNFNKNQNPLDLNFILRTCVNGIVRFNTKGEFNNSFHLSRRGMDPKRFRNNVLIWHKVIRGVIFTCQDYRESLQIAEKGDFIYLDPPYAENKQRYIDEINIDVLFTELENLNRKRINWALSFDGRRGSKKVINTIPKELYKHHILINSGNSAVNKVLNSNIEQVEESLYINY